MSRPLRIEYPGACYHVTSRGNEQKDIFGTRSDRKRFLEYLESASQRYNAVVHAYCLMSNHYHLLLETPSGNLSSIMHHINGAYTTYYNIKKSRAGHLFQGRFKAILIDAQSYLLELSRYIHLNPVRAKMVERPEQYEWSSYRCYIGSVNPPEWLTTDFILASVTSAPEMANRFKEYRLFVESRRGYEYESPLTDAFGASILGGAAFVRRITFTYLQGREDNNIPALRRFTGCVTAEEIIAETKAQFHDNEKLAKKACIYLCREVSGLKLSDIGERFAMRDTAISETARRFTGELERNSDLREKVNKLKEKLKTGIDVSVKPVVRSAVL